MIYLMLRANHAYGEWNGIPIQRGQILTGRKSISDKLCITERAVRTCLKNLKATGEIAIETTSTHSIITICNYDVYQDTNFDSDQVSDQRSANERPSSDQVATTNKKNKKKNKNNTSVLRLKLIKIFSPNPRQRRSDRENEAWKHRVSEVNAKDVEILIKFYEEQRGKEADQTWKRKLGVVDLLNDYTEQVELADAFFHKGKNDPSKLGRYRQM